MMDAPAVMPVVSAGISRQDRAFPGVAQPVSGKPCAGSNPNSPVPRENSRISSRPPHNAGTAPPTIAMPWNRPRSRGLRVRTAAQPSGRPIASAISRLSTIRGNVTAARMAICRATGRPPTVDTPRSPCSRPAIQSPYCATSGLSKPNSARSDAMRSGVAFVPAMTAATSPGNTRSITNTSADRPTKAATNSASRFPTNRMEIPFPYLFLEICHNGSTVWLSLLGKPCTCLSTATVTR